MKNNSIFETLFSSPSSLIDLKMAEPSLPSVDVIIPVFNTNPFWKTNLLNYYKTIPINRLLIGNGGCKDNTLEIAKQFPRVVIIDQTKYKTLGFSLRNLIEAVETEWFIYLHSDVFLPADWFKMMSKNQTQYDWFESNQRSTVLFDFLSHDHAKTSFQRAYSGAQMGRKNAFNKIIKKIDDDFLYRNEDIVLANLIESNGFKYGRVSETFIYHQVTNKNGELEPKISSINIERVRDVEWEMKTMDMQIRGIIKYTQPNSNTIDNVMVVIKEMKKTGSFHKKEFLVWIKETNPTWLFTVKKILILLIIQSFIKETKITLKLAVKKIVFPEIKKTRS